MADRKKYYYLITGVFVGVIFFSVVRTIYYLLRGYQPNMSPFMFIVFSPMVGMLLSMVALITELIINRVVKRSYSDRIEALLVGLSYTTITVVLIEKWLLLLFVLFNPITVHLFFQHKIKTRK